MPRNPSELARLQQEWEDLRFKLIHSGALNTKSQKERWLAELRDVEKQLGIKGANYNSDEFKFNS